ncbi:class I SAM-dependent DNA methyltransferase [Chelatococcus reniformis]|uniref:Methyltransferase n=1 Tax=Chelatococcus reniformis TaxID=1494448 RepID=A0A916UQK1_9HYPH|nr:methyltransferase domain-containing protein [Chelatococcus reniformis]GGC83435.1 methyltransferase [Chelatococcus reniformis]
MTTTVRSSGNLLADRRFAWAEAAFADGDPAAAADLAAQVLELAADYAPAWLLLGRAKLGLGEETAAQQAFIEALRADPADELGAALHLARLEGPHGEGATAAMSPDYVRGLFDGYAARFDTHLTDALAYRGPQLIMAALARAGGLPRFSRVVDLGCGTGLMGAAIRPYADELVGCDLSPGMVRQAQAKTIYDRLHVADLVAHMQQLARQSCDLLLAADVLVYIGDLAPLFDAAARAQPTGGLFAFTVQRPLDGADTGAPGEAVLGADLRYAHGEPYLRRRLVEAGFEVCLVDEASTRLDRGEPVPGLVVVARRR